MLFSSSTVLVTVTNKPVPVKYVYNISVFYDNCCSTILLHVLQYAPLL